MSHTVQIGHHTLGQAGTCYVVAEIGLNHNGDRDLAHQLIEAAAQAGADAVKFQKRTVDRLATGAVLDAEDNRFPAFGKTYREIREHLEFGPAAYEGFKARAEAAGLDFLVTAFDTAAVDFLESLGVTFYKLASHSLTNLPLLEYVAAIGKPVLLSTGMSELEEVDRAVEIFRRREVPLVLMQRRP